MTILLADDDETLSGLARHELTSPTDPLVRYQFGQLLGTGSMGFAYFGMRATSQSRTPVVLKMLRPHFVTTGAGALIVKKEVEALSRLNKRVPPTPFVVQLVDSGEVEVTQAGQRFALPWLALEYVHGGAQGTTLSERLVHSVEQTGHAFERQRAAHAVECIAQGIEAIHQEGIIHRDLTPNNVLCCGSGDEEIFKISDFGLARPVGITGTFGGMVVGTVGYSPPEQAALDDRQIGPWSDVFTFAVDQYFLLTGHAYFPGTSVGAMLHAVRATERKSLLDSPMLSPALRADPEACRVIDQALARATARRPEDRPSSASQLASVVVPALRGAARSRTVDVPVGSVAPDDSAVPTYRWTLRHRADGARVVRSVAWDGDGRCLAATSEGLSFWDGADWRDVAGGELPSSRGIRFVHRRSAGKFLIGGDGALLASFDSRGVQDVVRGPSERETFVAADGDVDDLAVFVGERGDGPPVLYTLTSRRWLKPLALDGVKTVAGLARLADDRWLLAGRRAGGGAYFAEVAPLAWSVTEHEVPPARALVAVTARQDRGLGLAVGSDGLVVRLEDGVVTCEQLSGSFDLSAAALDFLGREWVASARRIWMRPVEGAHEPVWEDDSLQAPIVSLFADLGRVIALMADGSVLEGHHDNR